MTGLLQAGADPFAGATIATFNYDLPDATVNIENVPVRDYLLAKAFPARTGALGSRLNSEWDPQTGNFDMSDPDANETLMTDPSNWFDSEQEYQGRAAWYHSDIKDAPYVHIYKLYNKMTGKEN